MGLRPITVLVASLLRGVEEVTGESKTGCGIPDATL